jgi:hypothetical protein
MRLPILLRISNSLLQNILRLLYELPMQVYCIVRDSSCGVVLSEDVFRSLLVVLIHLRSVGFSFFRQLVRGSSIAAFIGLMCL